MDYQKQRKKSQKIEKQIIGIFALFGIIALIVGFFNFRSNISSPFLGLRTDYNIKTEDQEQAEEILALKSQDTDNDGLIDFDELYQYKTSPYIADSDSDGFPDGEEIKSGNDPNCPEGQTCLNIVTTDTTDESNTNQDVIAAEDITPEQLRVILLQNGVAQEQLSELDDDTLMDLYTQVVGETGETIGSDENINQETSDDPYADLLHENVNGFQGVTTAEDLQNLSAAEIRELLRTTGNLSEEDLANMTDDQLQSIFLQSLKDQNLIE